MKVLHVCSEDAVPMQNIIKVYQKYSKETLLQIDLSFDPESVKGYDIVHGHYALTKTVIRVQRKARRAGVPFVLHCHGSDVRRITSNHAEKLPFHLNFMSKRIRKKSDVVILSTPDLMEWANGVYIPNPVDIENFIPMDIGKKSKILLMGRFTRDGGILDMIDPNKDYDCINWGEDIQFPNNVTKIPFTKYEELPELLNHYDKMIGPQIDPVSLARLEAMSCGLKTYTNFPQKYAVYYGFNNPDKTEDPRGFIKKYHHPKKILKILMNIYESLV